MFWANTTVELIMCLPDQKFLGLKTLELHTDSSLSTVLRAEPTDNHHQHPVSLVAPLW